MPDSFLHTDEMACTAGYLADGLCCAVIGLSNTGKSTLLRTLCSSSAGRPAGLGDDQALLVYVDCNRMLDLTEQGFYETVLRATRSRLQDLGLQADLLEPLDQAYNQVVHPPNPFAIAVGFSEGVERVCDHIEQRIILVLDEFDEPFEALDGRTFLNLRALRDRYGTRLTYAIGIERTLDEIRDDEETAEFRELFATRGCRLRMLPEGQAAEWVRAMAEAEGIQLDDGETGFVVSQAGGHPGLLVAVTGLLLRARTVAPETYARMGSALVSDALTGDRAVHHECARLWAQLPADLRRAIHTLIVGEAVEPALLQTLTQLGLTDEDGTLFGEAFASFVDSLARRRPDLPDGVWLDADAGEVYVDGRKTATLTDLEYRLLQTLYARKDKLCDKYHLVEEVWGEAFIDEVDDARIEKLVSRLRAKVEEDPTDPRYLVTVRGRGYRLLSQPAAPEHGASREDGPSGASE